MSIIDFVVTVFVIAILITLFYYFKDPVLKGMNVVIDAVSKAFGKTVASVTPNISMPVSDTSANIEKKKKEGKTTPPRDPLMGFAPNQG